MQHEAHIDCEQFQAMAPNAYECMIGLGKAVDASGLDKGLSELVKLRVSLMNACAFCTALHQGTARKIGVEAKNWIWLRPGATLVSFPRGKEPPLPGRNT